MAKAINKEIKKLWDWTRKDHEVTHEFFNEIVRRYTETYKAAGQFDEVNKKNILRMIALNRKYNVVGWHLFMINIDDSKL